MTLLTVCFVAGMLMLIAAAWMGDEEDELADDADRMRWIDHLADQSRKGRKTCRSRYSMTGWRRRG